MPRYPKPDDERRNANQPAFGWVDLPPKSGVRSPKLPPIREWTDETKRWWSDLWSKPQATQWDRAGSTAVAMAVLYDDLQTSEPGKAAGILAELRQHEDRHGLNPKSMLQLRWRIGEVEAKPAAATKPKTAADRRGRVLEILPGGNVAS